MGAALEVGTVWSNCWLVRSLDMPFGGCKVGFGFVNSPNTINFPGSCPIHFTQPGYRLVIFQESGTGREGTVHSLEAFTEEKTVCVKIS